MLIVSKFRVVGERCRELADINHVRQADTPRVERLDFRFGENGALHFGDKFRERTYIDTDSVPAGSQRLDERCPTPDVGIEAEVTAFRKCVYGGTDKCGTEASRILIETVREAAHRLSISCTRD